MKTILALLTCICVYFDSYGQRCADDSLKTYPSEDILYSDQGFANGGLTPCILSGAYSELIIPFGTYHQRGQQMILPDSSTTIVSNIYSVRIDDVVSLPGGFCWTIRPASGIIHDKESGVLIIKGTASLSPGSVIPLSVKISVDTQGNNSYTYTDLDAWNYKPFMGQVVIRSIDASGSCPQPNF